MRGSRHAWPILPLILKSFDDLALKTYIGSHTPPNFRWRLNQRSTPVSSLGNCYPDHLFHRARRLLHRIALNEGSRGGDQPSNYLSLDQDDLDQDTAIQAKRPDSKHPMPAAA